MSVAERAATTAGCSEAEYALICQVLEREPNGLELGMFGVLWSEHCSYKHSKPLLRRLPTAAAHVLQGPGENAGAVDIGGGLAAVMKIESHNHPSAVEPFQGAATGVGGILRDIFTMGARPIALMDALCFGDPHLPRTAYLLNGVVGGIAFYGNCVGVPTVGGSIAFDASYSANPLVNVLCLGVGSRDRLLSARARGVGNPVLLVGSATGRDGIAGASFASAQLSDESEAQRPAVQVGNPFLEKLLIEACLELTGDPDVVAMQDLGAAGLIGATAEMAARGGCGIEIDVSLVPRREQGMSGYEVMLSESQERMLLVVRRGSEERVRRRFERWDLHCAAVGRVTADGLIRVRDGEEVVAELPARFLSGGAPEYEGTADRGRGTGAPVILSEAKDLPGDASPVAQNGSGEVDAPFPVPSDLSATLLELLGSANLCSRRTVFEQYDHMVQTNTVVPPGEGAAALRLKGSPSGLALGLGGNGRLAALDPWTGGAAAVAEACRNVACAGARPVALTDCLNFGDPERAGVWEALVGVVEGMRDACLALDVPIISGNVSLYNETDGEPVAPTPIVGALGVLDDIERHARTVFAEGQTVWLLGPLEASLAGSEYGALRGWSPNSPAPLDLRQERDVQECVRELVAGGVVETAIDLADGGLALALAEPALASRIGVRCAGAWVQDLEVGKWGRADAILFGEAPSRIILAAAHGRARQVESAAARRRLPLMALGVTGGTSIDIGSLVSVALDDALAVWSTGLDRVGGA